MSANMATSRLTWLGVGVRLGVGVGLGLGVGVGLGLGLGLWLASRLTSTMEESSVYNQRKGEAHGSRSWRDTGEIQGRYRGDTPRPKVA